MPPIKPSVASLTLAELSLQRGDFEHGRYILEQRVTKGASDFKTLNLYGICLAHARLYDNAATIFERIRRTRLSKTYRIKALFNLGLVCCYRDLSQVGDLSISATALPKPGPFTVTPQALEKAFDRPLTVWRELVDAKGERFQDVIHTYLAFAFLQKGDLDESLNHLALALDQHENFFVTHFLLGRLFLDLYQLGVEGNHFPMKKSDALYYDIEDYELIGTSGERKLVHPTTLLDIALQSFVEARNINPTAVEVYLNLTRAYLGAGLYEEAEESMARAESLAPSSPDVVETALYMRETYGAKPEQVQALMSKLKNVRRKDPEPELFNILPPYYLY